MGQEAYGAVSARSWGFWEKTARHSNAAVAGLWKAPGSSADHHRGSWATLVIPSVSPVVEEGAPWGGTHNSPLLKEQPLQPEARTRPSDRRPPLRIAGLLVSY